MCVEVTVLCNVYRGGRVSGRVTAPSAPCDGPRRATRDGLVVLRYCLCSGGPTSSGTGRVQRWPFLTFLAPGDGSTRDGRVLQFALPCTGVSLLI